MWVSPMASALSQEAGVVVVLFCVKTIEGQFTSLIMAGALTRVRLFLSPVKPVEAQVGGVAPIPLLTRVLTSIVEPPLKSAEGVPEESPKILNSLTRQPLARSGKWLSPGALNIMPPDAKVTWSVVSPLNVI